MIKIYKKLILTLKVRFYHIFKKLSYLFDKNFILSITIFV